jgi:hypothetical protein
VETRQVCEEHYCFPSPLCPHTLCSVSARPTLTNDHATSTSTAWMQTQPPASSLAPSTTNGSPPTSSAAQPAYASQPGHSQLRELAGFHLTSRGSLRTDNSEVQDICPNVKHGPGGLLTARCRQHAIRRLEFLQHRFERDPGDYF